MLVRGSASPLRACLAVRTHMIYVLRAVGATGLLLVRSRRKELPRRRGVDVTCGGEAQEAQLKSLSSLVAGTQHARRPASHAEQASQGSEKGDACGCVCGGGGHRLAGWPAGALLVIVSGAKKGNRLGASPPLAACFHHAHKTQSPDL
jgi:hypothetical protein